MRSKMHNIKYKIFEDKNYHFFCYVKKNLYVFTEKVSILENKSKKFIFENFENRKHITIHEKKIIL